MIEKKNFEMKFLKLILPFIIGLGTIGSISLMLPGGKRGIYWSLVSAYFFPPLGKESVIPTGIVLGFDPLLMALSIAFVDIIVALFLVWNYELAKQIPFVGRFMAKIEKLGKKSSSKYAWIKPLEFIGIILFVMVPFQGSGGLVGSIIGRLIGMKPKNTFLAITVGAITGCTLIAYFSNAIFTVFIQNFLLGVLIIILLIITGIMIYAYRRNKKNRKKLKLTE